MPIRRSNPVNKNHPLNRGRLGWWLSIAGWDGGNTVYDLMGITPATAVGQTEIGWAANSRPVALGLAFSSTGGANAYFRNTSASISIPSTGMPLSIAFWVRTLYTFGSYFSVANSDGPGCVVFVNSDTLYWDYVNRVSCAFGPGVGGAFGGVSGLWTRVVAVSNALNFQAIYCNGILQASSSASISGFSAISGVAVFGSAVQGGASQVDDASIWNRVLSAAEVAQDYDLSRRGYPGVLNRTRLVSPARGVLSHGLLSGGGMGRGILTGGRM